jgi:SAM-dependent methyltransferase
MELRAEINTARDILENKSTPPILKEEYKTLKFSSFALQKLMEEFEFTTILDIGSGSGQHSDIFLKKGKQVTAIDFGKSTYYETREHNYTVIMADYYHYEFKEKFDAIWASHVLEHQPNPNLFLRKINQDLKEGGVLAITVPPLKHEIVGGHLTLWNAGLLLYQLVFAGFNCRSASVLKYEYNISVILRKETIQSFPDLSFDKGDIEALLPYFPSGFSEPFNGNIHELNWSS